MIKVRFFCYTEYHLLLSFLIKSSHYSDNDDIIIYTFFSEKRLSEKYIYQKENCRIYPVRYQSVQEIDAITKSLDYSITKVFIFNEDEPLMGYLIRNFKGSDIALVQDGLKPYINCRKKFEFFSTLKDTLSAYIYIKKKELEIPWGYLFQFYRYASSKEISEIWLSNPEAFNNKYNKKLKQIPRLLDLSPTLVDQLFKIFNKEPLELAIHSEKVVFYVHQSIWYDEYKSAELDLLKFLRNRFGPDVNIIIKLHPLADENEEISFKSEVNAIIIRDKVPAELYILSLNKSIVISAWSTALLTNNPNCKFYYTMNIMPYDKILKQLTPLNPTSHVLTISSVSQIVF
jgi:hypothetical protein